MDPGQIKISDYSYELPGEKIAKHPAATRDGSRLLIYDRGEIRPAPFTAIADVLDAGSLVIFNNSRVVAARVIFTKSTGGQVEVFMLEPNEHNGEITQAMLRKGRILTWCLVGGAGKWKKGLVLEKRATVKGDDCQLTARIAGRDANRFLIEFAWSPDHHTFSDILEAFGAVPIPPYLQRPAEALDSTRYQTIYARHDGSVAAPTAGLHFTPAVLENLAAKNIGFEYLTLHVGAGTFKPVTAENLAGHQMHAECLECSVPLINSLLQKEEVVTVGTTSMRCMESLYWLGVKVLLHPNFDPQELNLQQWEVYRPPLSRTNYTKQEALAALKTWMIHHAASRLITHTALLIAPGYRFRICKKLITNFHQPNSTLLLLVAAFIGEDWRKVYQYALNNDFRFLSYGDSSVLIPGSSAVGDDQ